MISYKVYYDYHEGIEAPIWIVLNVRDQMTGSKKRLQ